MNHRPPTTDEIQELAETPQSYHELMSERADEINTQLAAEWEQILQDESKYNEIIRQRKAAHKEKTKALHKVLPKDVSREWAEFKAASNKQRDDAREQKRLNKIRLKHMLTSDTPEAMIDELETRIAQQLIHKGDAKAIDAIHKMRQSIVELGGVPRETGSAPPATPANQANHPSDAEIDALLSEKSPNGRKLGDSIEPPPDDLLSGEKPNEQVSGEDDEGWIRDNA